MFDNIFGGIGILIVVTLYFLPSFAARGKRNAGSVFVVNLFFGWTFIGWVVAMAMAVGKDQPPVYVGQAPPQMPPGWYPDPYRQGNERYWTGQQWEMRPLGSRPIGHVAAGDRPAG